ncbi:class A beta-lactamase-related serine hydrolase [Sphingomonas gei]|uniref:Class A beta-lactamase-related serine hydrolase n=1 Tax=Sphingomonas gei TaxID=1395960 RepID=A0A4S1XAM8_9SPHN|nr:serine hydrolase domain-containing protein [Sphingomonas gei]TGX53161.1 class A beta-lactamase-related serine hydrolase [Sphingomonas gei]
MTRFPALLGAAIAASLLCSAALSSAAVAQTPRTAAYAVPQTRIAGLADFVDGVMAQQIATREVAGAVVTVVHRGRVLFTRGYGFADVDKGVPVDAQRTLFRPGSVSKMFTWTALLQQVELGRVSLDADVNTYLDFKIPPLEGKPIRVRDLFSHTVGMSDVAGITAPSVDKLVPYREWMKTHIPKRLWPAGTEVSYSNYGAALAGYIVEQVSGEPFPDYVERHIFKPLDMHSSTFREPLPAALAPRMATGYGFKEGRFEAKPFELFSMIMPAGSGTSSGPDMNRFMMAMLNGGALGKARILKPESVKLLMRDSRANAPDLPGMAHGFFVVREAGPRLVGHGGNTGDFHSNMILAPEAGLGFFISETGGQGSYGGRTELTEALIGRLFPQTPMPRVAAPAGEKLPLGAYRGNRRDYSRPIDPERDLKVAAAGANAVTVLNDGRTTYWERVGPMLFEQVTGARAGGPYERLRFYGEVGRWRLSFSSQPHTTYHLVQP